MNKPQCSELLLKEREKSKSKPRPKKAVKMQAIKVRVSRKQTKKVLAVNVRPQSLYLLHKVYGNKLRDYIVLWLEEKCKSKIYNQYWVNYLLCSP